MTFKFVVHLSSGHRIHWGDFYGEDIIATNRFCDVKTVGDEILSSRIELVEFRSIHQRSNTLDIIHSAISF